MNELNWRFSQDLKLGDGELAVLDMMEIQDLHDWRTTGKNPWGMERHWNLGILLFTE